MILKILRASEWNALRGAGRFEGSADDLRDGFIHFSSLSQVVGTAAKHFRDEPDLTLVACEESAFGDALRWEVSRNGERFPHLYAALDLRDVSWAEPFDLGPDGVHILPERLK